MKKFIFKLVCYFILPIAVISFPLDFGISYFLKKSIEYPGEFEVMNDIYNSKANCDIAIYGSSRAWVHVDPEIVKDSLNLSVYNFGNDGHSFDLQYLRHLEFFKYNKKPKTIILSVDMFSLKKEVGLYAADQYLPYMLWNENVRSYTDSYISYDVWDYYIPLVRYIGKSSVLRESLKYLKDGTSKQHYRHNGFLGMDKQWNADFDKLKSKRKSYKAQVNKNIRDLLEVFIKECKGMKINLILLYTPEFIEGQHFVSNRNEIIGIYKELSKRYNLCFYDFSNDNMCYEKTLFYNVNHLNSKGAEIFTKKFAGILKSNREKLRL
ncbi:hypothetical protein [Flavobacterium daemonense]|uniref:hypothetical protein n=1 Tax=Flavobacterium daemonense TaxID=1393049 RepID=UPI0011872DBD|nr:hypothetical protein [Flavobacterium daemonense]KAF2335613.1 hypothetical protein FND99_05485 [Flavobacterium daemonense]